MFQPEFSNYADRGASLVLDTWQIVVCIVVSRNNYTSTSDSTNDSHVQTNDDTNDYI